MTQRTRKFIGVWLLIALLLVYPIAVAVFYSTYLMALPWWAAVLVFCAFGLAWALPAGMVIKWMVKPDPEAND